MIKLWKHLTFTITPFAHLLDLFKTLRVFINKKSVFADWINWKGNIYQWKYDCVRNSIYDSPLSQKIPGCWSATLLRKYSITTAFRIMLWKFEGQSSLTTLAYSPMPKRTPRLTKQILFLFTVVACTIIQLLWRQYFGAAWVQFQLGNLQQVGNCATTCNAALGEKPD